MFQFCPNAQEFGLFLAKYPEAACAIKNWTVVKALDPSLLLSACTRLLSSDREPLTGEELLQQLGNPSTDALLVSALVAKATEATWQGAAQSAETCEKLAGSSTRYSPWF